MARYPRQYNTLAPLRYQIREGVRGGFYVLDTAPESFSRIEGTQHCVKDTHAIMSRNERGEYLYRTYNGARNHAVRLNALVKEQEQCYA